ncbi:hypothetical protein V8C86DRAFT_3090302 [Haematococcus lacustris]
MDGNHLVPNTGLQASPGDAAEDAKEPAAEEGPEAELPAYDENEAWDAWSMGTCTTDVEEGVAPQSDIARDAAEFEETLRKHAEAQAKADAKEPEEGP